MNNPDEERVLKVPKFKHDILASVRSQCMGLWQGIACQRKLIYVMKLKLSSETLRPIFLLNLWIFKFMQFDFEELL